jgi:hypothetical protein
MTPFLSEEEETSRDENSTFECDVVGVPRLLNEVLWQMIIPAQCLFAIFSTKLIAGFDSQRHAQTF